jgi:hypothetical protein
MINKEVGIDRGRTWETQTSDKQTGFWTEKVAQRCQESRHGIESLSLSQIKSNFDTAPNDGESGSMVPSLCSVQYSKRRLNPTFKSDSITLSNLQLLNYAVSDETSVSHGHVPCILLHMLSTFYKMDPLISPNSMQPRVEQDCTKGNN